MADIERKIALYRAMFECNVSGDRDPNYIKSESLMIELIAGGLNWQQQEYVIGQLEPNEWKEVGIYSETFLNHFPWAIKFQVLIRVMSYLYHWSRLFIPLSILLLPFK